MAFGTFSYPKTAKSRISFGTIRYQPAGLGQDANQFRLGVTDLVHPISKQSLHFSAASLTTFSHSPSGLMSDDPF
jgi:hypothetical protein